MLLLTQLGRLTYRSLSAIGCPVTVYNARQISKPLNGAGSQDLCCQRPNKKVGASAPSSVFACAHPHAVLALQIVPLDDYRKFRCGSKRRRRVQ
jgi:hypothetical protein